MPRHLGDRTERAASPWEDGTAVPKQGAQGMVYMRAAWHHRQSMLVRTGMSRRMMLLLTLCNSPLAGAAQVAADMVGNLVEAAPLSTAPVKRVLRSAAPLARLLRRALPWEARPAQAGLRPHVHAGSKLLTRHASAATLASRARRLRQGGCDRDRRLPAHRRHGRRCCSLSVRRSVCMSACPGRTMSAGVGRRPTSAGLRRSSSRTGSCRVRARRSGGSLRVAR
jgi:hypothetical protein